MPAYPFVTVDVFTDQRFGGNPLAIFTDAKGLTDAQMQTFAREMNLSETTFVLPPESPANAAKVRIFMPSGELPFAGHPMVGTGWWLAQQGLAKDGVLRIEVAAGLVEVQVKGDSAVVAAPLPLALGQEAPVETVAACLGLSPSDIVTNTHRPIAGGVGADFIFAEVTADALGRAAADISAYRRANDEISGLNTGVAIHFYVREGSSLRTRMFAPLNGIIEDPATGSANAALAALLLSLSDDSAAAFQITQGDEMGRPSRLAATARRTSEGVFATIGGGCVPVLKGEAAL